LEYNSAGQIDPRNVWRDIKTVVNSAQSYDEMMIEQCTCKLAKTTSARPRNDIMLSDRAWSEKYSESQLNTKRDLLRACLDHYAIKLYLAITVIALIGMAASSASLLVLPIAIVVTVFFYPLVEYALHRFVLHSNLLYRSPLTAPIWRRLHYDHHMKPTNLSVLFAEPMTSVPLLLILAAIPGLVIDLNGLFAAMVATNFLMFTYYEFMHASAHLKIGIPDSWIVRHKQSHLRHHFIQETQNFGIGTQVMDTIAGTTGQSSEQSSTVRNLGYDDQAAKAYPWVREGYERDHGAS
jgi:sterol desaturase/sphingolipid hydroxylase (fatty acid hydroxylase superfamily)